ncbi:MAG: hypothetical protein LBP59_06245 [Planctomycetaceae bacterium]|jgi:hypothetical protein|nr:hypothetical protein [Planctomycetaceae bacterium]
MLLQIFRFILILVIISIAIEVESEELGALNYSSGSYGRFFNRPLISSKDAKLVTEIPKFSFVTGELLQMKLYIQNITKSTKNIDYDNFQILIQYDNNRSIKIRPLRRNKREYDFWKNQKIVPDFGRLYSETLASNKKIYLSSIYLNNQYDMTLEGNYSVFVTMNNNPVFCKKNRRY